MAEITPGTLCRARTRFPWQGVLRSSVTFPGYAAFEAGTLVAVTGDATPAGFQVRVGRVRDQPEEPSASGLVGRDQVDEVAGAVIEDRLLRSNKIHWSLAPAWKDMRYVAAKDFCLKEVGQDGQPKAAVRVSRGERFSAALIGASYWIERAGVAGAVTRDELFFDSSIPPPTSADGVGLLCYELGPYAAALAGACPHFVHTAVAKNSKSPPDASVYWIEASGGVVQDQKYTRDQLGQARLQRGDFVLFYSDAVARHSIHTAVATGDGQGLYSLWEAQGESIVVTTIQDLFDLELDEPMVCVKIATPGWHLS